MRFCWVWELAWEILLKNIVSQHQFSCHCYHFSCSFIYFVQFIYYPFKDCKLWYNGRYIKFFMCNEFAIPWKFIGPDFPDPYKIFFYNAFFSGWSIKLDVFIYTKILLGLFFIFSDIYIYIVVISDPRHTECYYIYKFFYDKVYSEFLRQDSQSS